MQFRLALTFVAQAGLELTAILLPQPPKCWDYRRAPPQTTTKKFFETTKQKLVLITFLTITITQN